MAKIPPKSIEPMKLPDLELYGYDIFCPDVGGDCKVKTCAASFIYHGVGFVEYRCSRWEKTLSAPVGRDGKALTPGDVIIYEKG